MGQSNPYISGESVSTTSTTVSFNFKFYGDKLFYRTYSSYNNSWGSYTGVGADNDNSFKYNGLSRSVSFSRMTDHSYFQTVHCRIYDFDWLGWNESGYSHIFRSYYQAIYVPQKSGTWITNDKMFYKKFTGKDQTTNVYVSGVGHGEWIYQTDLDHLYSYATSSYYIDSSKSRNWFTEQHSGTNSYSKDGSKDNPTQSSSYPWPW